MTYCSLMALIESKNIQEDKNIRLISLFDNEEIGSTSAHGANSNLLPSTLERIVASIKPSVNTKLALEKAIHKSMLFSADMAHAVHPNYA